MSDLIDDPRVGENAPEYTVSEISGAVKRTLEGEFGRVRVRGEIGRVVRARSGHLYFDVKDDRSVLACTTWKGQAARLSVQPEEGLEVIVTGKLTSYGAQSKYNLNVDDMAVAGEGALMAMLEKRKKMLAAEGLFAPERKQKLPFLPEVIGVVTSPSGAVIRDILHRLRDRFPRKVLLWPVAVQGQNCAPEVVRAIEGFNALSVGGALPRPDLIIVARGGGSIEDLWGFNEENVARAAAASDIPLISAVGHETDTTLIDYASDWRAPTPTAAAEIAVPVRAELQAWTDDMGARLSRARADMIEKRGQRLRDVARALPKPESLVAAARQRLDHQDERLPRALQSVAQHKRVGLVQVAGGFTPNLLTRMIRDKRTRSGDWGARLAPSLGKNTELSRRKAENVTTRLRPTLISRETTRHGENLAAVMMRLSRAGTAQIDTLSRKLDALERMRQSLGYKNTLKRGYAVVHGVAGVVTSAHDAAQTEIQEIEFHDGRVGMSGVDHVAAKPTPPEAPAVKPKPKTPDDNQGSLF